ncbi:MAG: ribonuclease E/G, partial [Gemmatimonadetes bacterium]|nr:ribonuclease E/G [Gemmatimonadota bacterium]
MMKREILISATQREVRVAILEDDQLVELAVERPEARRMVGDIYLGKVDAVLPGIQAAFIDIGTEKSAFLHSSDLVYDEDGDDDDDDDDDSDGADDAAEIPEGDDVAASEASPQPQKRRGGGRRKRKDPPQIQDVLKRGQSLVVQVSKEPISTKGPRCTAQVSLAGRFLVFMPHASRVGVSRKIGERAERQRLRELVQNVLPKDVGGVIVRTVGEDVTSETFEREINALVSTWQKIEKKKKFVGAAPKLLHRETSLTRGIIRDLFSAKVDKLTVDSKQVYNEIVEYLTSIAPALIERV